METEIVAALIGAGATLLVGVISTPWLSKYLTIRKYQRIYLKQPLRISCLEGKWTGNTSQNFGVSGTNMTSTLTVDIKIKKNIIHGRSIINWVENGKYNSIEVGFEGGFISENFIRILYQPNKENIQNFGVVFLKLNSSGDSLTGMVVGYGHRIESIFFGNSELKKN